MIKKPYNLFLIALIVTLLVACNLPFYSNRESSQDAPDAVSQSQPDILVVSRYKYSPDQVTVIQERGNPTRFTLIFANEDRQETWYYDTTGVSVMFLNGYLAAKKQTSPQYQENSFATTYTPDLFLGGMGFDEIMAVTGKDEFTISAIEGLDRDAHLLHMEGLSIGLLEGKINFVETHPALTEQELEPADFSAAFEEYTPTVDEIANEGTHTYLVVTYVDNEFVGEDRRLMEIDFAPDGVHLIENGTVTIYPRVEPNKYTDLDGFLRLTFMVDGFIWFEPSVNGSSEVEILHSRLDD